jgi:hypothetical protein
MLWKRPEKESIWSTCPLIVLRFLRLAKAQNESPKYGSPSSSPMCSVLDVTDPGSSPWVLHSTSQGCTVKGRGSETQWDQPSNVDSFNDAGMSFDRDRTVGMDLNNSKWAGSRQPQWALKVLHGNSLSRLKGMPNSSSIWVVLGTKGFRCCKEGLKKRASDQLVLLTVLRFLRLEKSPNESPKCASPSSSPMRSVLDVTDPGPSPWVCTALRCCIWHHQFADAITSGILV